MAQPKKAKVTVELTKSSTAPFDWEIKSVLKKGQRLEFKNQNHPGFDVHFDIDDKDKTGFLFPDDHTLAIAVQTYQGSPPPCPTQGQTWCEFCPVRVSENNTRLEVRNLNENPAEFSYTLFLTKDPHGSNPKFEPIDPIGSNQNGPRFSSSTTIIAFAFGAAAVTLAIAYSFNLFERR